MFVSFMWGISKISILGQLMIFNDSNGNSFAIGLPPIFTHLKLGKFSKCSFVIS